MGNIKNTNRYIKFRTDCVEKQADLLLKEVLNYYNIPIRSSNERILSIDYYNPVERILKLSYSKESKVNNKGEIYAINITLIECVGANFVKYDYKNGNSLYNMYIDEFLVTVNGRKINTSLKILKELNDEVLLKIDKPFNLGNPILINNEDWHDVVILAPIKGFKSEKIDILKKSFISNKDFILSYIKRYLKEKNKYNDDLICDDFKVSIEYNGKDRYEDYESYVFVDIYIKLNEHICRVYLYLNAFHYSLSKKVDWLYIDEVKIVVDKDVIMDMKNKAIRAIYLDFIDTLNRKFMLTSKKIYKCKS